MRIPLDIITSLRQIANRAGSPTMDYSPVNALREQRESLDWIAKEAKKALDTCKLFNDDAREKMEFEERQ